MQLVGPISADVHAVAPVQVGVLVGQLEGNNVDLELPLEDIDILGRVIWVGSRL